MPENIPPVKLPDTAAMLAAPIRDRWSPRAFLDKSVYLPTLRALLEAARWAASSSNEQPWHFIVARKEDAEEYARLLSVLVEKNQQWAKSAPVLLLSVAKKTRHNGKPNRHYLHDTGAASATLCIQAAAMGLQAHSMGGFDMDKAQSLFGIPAEYEPGAAIAVGYPGPAESLSEDFRKSELAPRSRRPLSETAFTTHWGAPVNLG